MKTSDGFGIEVREVDRGGSPGHRSPIIDGRHTIDVRLNVELPQILQNLKLPAGARGAICSQSLTIACVSAKRADVG